MGRLARFVGVIAAILFAAGCGNGANPAAIAADRICSVIDNEPDTAAAFERYETIIARELGEGLDSQQLLTAVKGRCGRSVAVISAGAAETDPPRQEDHRDEPVPVDLGEVNWVSQPWATTCALTDNLDLPDMPIEVTLEPLEEPHGSWWGYARPDEPVPQFSVDLDEVLRADVTGDGTEEAIFRAACVPGNAMRPMLIVWTVSDGLLVQLPELWMENPAVIDRYEVVGGVIRAVTREPAPGTAPVHGYPIEVTTEWTLDGEVWISQERSRIDTEAQPEPPTPVPGCETPNASAQDAAQCLLAAANANDWELAAKVALPSAVEFVRESRGSGPIEWDFNGCSETCWFSEPSNDPGFHGVGIEMGIGTSDGGSIIEWIEAYG